MKSGFESPFSTRYASRQMQGLFSQEKKFRTFRRLWVALARAQQELGLPITDEQISEMEAHVDDINFDVAEQREREVRHDVMAHVYAYGVQCPRAAGIIHLGATSCYVDDNTDILIMRDALRLVRSKLLGVIKLLGEFAMQYKDRPCLAYTHLQPAQLTTVGKRASLWLNEFLMDFEEIEYRLSRLQLLGSKGATGTQASFMELFDGDTDKIDQLEEKIAAAMDFESSVPVSGQTYSRKVDAQILEVLGGIAQSAAKFAGDMRLLQSYKELEEPFEKHQIGSSAMPYKRNPMRCERISALSRYLIIDTLNASFTSASQYFERTLDDSANRRIAMAEGFLCADSILNILLNVCDGIVVNQKVIERRVMDELPFMASENILMSAVRKGGNRQELHERIREHAIAAAAVVKGEGRPNDLIDRICADVAFGLTRQEVEKTLSPHNFTGRSAQQTERYVDEYIWPLLEKHGDQAAGRVELSV